MDNICIRERKEKRTPIIFILLHYLKWKAPSVKLGNIGWPYAWEVPPGEDM
jgi:hypothetical protein